MRQKIPALLISLLGAIFLANAINKALPSAPPQPLQYDRAVTLTGTLTQEFDMAFVDASVAPLKDPAVAEMVATEARRDHPGGTTLRAPIPHLILRLDKPVSVQAAGNALPAARDIAEIDLGDIPSGQFHLYGVATGSGRYTVTGTLSHASNEHHLRPLVLQVAEIKPAGQ